MGISLGGIVGGIGGFLTGGVGGAIAGYQAGSHLTTPGKPNLPALPPQPVGGGGILGSILNAGPKITFPGGPVYGPGGVPLPGYGGSPGTAMVHGHYKKNGQWSNRRRPRMNPMNVRAGRRAITRIRAAEKLFHRFLSVSHPGHTGRVKPKRIARR